MRLRAFISSVTKNNSSKIFLGQNSSENKDESNTQLRRDNERLAAEIKYLEDQNCNALVERDLEAKNARKNTGELNIVKRKLKEKERELQKITLEAQFDSPIHRDPTIE